MAWADDGYTRLVRWLKVLLPLAALALLSTVFLLSESKEASQDIPYSDIEIGEDGLIERVVEPSFAGATERGDLIAFVAASARPEGVGLGRLDATDFRGRIDLTTGGNITFRSDTAIVDQPDGVARLQGDVVIVSSFGYVVETGGLTTYLNDTRAESDGQITGHGPAGRFAAGKLVMTSATGGGDVEMVFTDGVKLVYEPRSD